MYENFLNNWSAWMDQVLRPTALFQACGEPSGSEAPRFISASFTAYGRTLRYRLFIPAGDRGGAMPLVVMLHGCGQDAADFASGTGMNELAGSQGCLVLYPEQSLFANWNMCWNWFDAVNQQRGQGEPALLAALTRRIVDDYAADPRRVSVAGLSSGASMALILGRTYPDIFNAVGCHSGLPHGGATGSHAAMRAMRDGADAPLPSDGPAGRSVPVIVFHGDDDATVHQNNGDAVVSQSILGYVASVPGGHEAMTAIRNSGQAQGRRFTRAIHRGADGGIVAEQWTVHGGGHAWSGGQPTGSHTDARGPDASREMLRFFAAR